MSLCYHCSDLHGHVEKYEKLFRLILKELPQAVFLTGDLLPGLKQLMAIRQSDQDFVTGFLLEHFKSLKSEMGTRYPAIFLILGNDDARIEEPVFQDAEHLRLWHYVQQRSACFGDYKVWGYTFVPPSPFRLKDWERYDVSRHLEPGVLAPEEGFFSTDVDLDDIRDGTIKSDLETLFENEDVSSGICLFHSPPYKTHLDRAALDGKMVDFAPLDVFIGSIAIRRFIEKRQPLLTLHGHVHESTQLTGHWKDQIGKTVCFNAAHRGQALSVIRFDPAGLSEAERILI